MCLLFETKYKPISNALSPVFSVYKLYVPDNNESAIIKS